MARRFEEAHKLLNRTREKIARIGEQSEAEQARLREEHDRLAAEAAMGKAFAGEEADRIAAQMSEARSKAKGEIQAAWAEGRAVIGTDAARDLASMRTQFADSESVSRRWNDAVKPLLETGLPVADVIATLAGDWTALAALEANLPSYLAAKTGKPNSPELVRALDEAMHAIDTAMIPHLPPSDQAERRMAREIGAQAVELDAIARYALKQADGSASSIDTIRVGITQATAASIAAGEYVAD